MISNKYLHNLRGSPFITELDWINEFKYTDLKNPTPSKDPNMDKFKNIKPVKKIDLKNPLNKQKLKLSPKDNGNKLKLNPNYSNKNKLKLGSDLGPTELDFIKIIDEVCKMIITKMKDAAGVENQSKPTTSISTVKNKEGDNSYSIEEIIKELEDDEGAGGVAGAGSVGDAAIAASWASFSCNERLYSAPFTLSSMMLAMYRARLSPDLIIFTCSQ